MPHLLRTVAAVFVLCSSAAFAEAPVPAKPIRLGLCAACHGESGKSLMKGTPHLAGQDLDYLKTALAAYRNGTRDVPLMRAVVSTLSVAELDELAAWYAAQAPAPR